MVVLKRVFFDFVAVDGKFSDFDSSEVQIEWLGGESAQSESANHMPKIIFTFGQGQRDIVRAFWNKWRSKLSVFKGDKAILVVGCIFTDHIFYKLKLVNFDEYIILKNTGTI